MTEEFWTSRPVLQHIRTLAQARMVGPKAVLAYALAEALATIPTYITLPPTVGGRVDARACVAGQCIPTHRNIMVFVQCIGWCP